jgi:hypothetical protein
MILSNGRKVVAGIGAFVLAVVIVLLVAWGGMGTSFSSPGRPAA